MFPIHSLVKGSLEYREMKCLYLQEKQNAEEWRKDYNVLKRQVVYLKSSTIRECSTSFIDLSRVYAYNTEKKTA